MSMLDKVIAAVTPPESDDARAGKRAPKQKKPRLQAIGWR